jgi:hypothetical protein
MTRRRSTPPSYVARTATNAERRDYLPTHWSCSLNRRGASEEKGTPVARGR